MTDQPRPRLVCFLHPEWSEMQVLLQAWYNRAFAELSKADTNRPVGTPEPAPLTQRKDRGR